MIKDTYFQKAKKRRQFYTNFISIHFIIRNHFVCHYKCKIASIMWAGNSWIELWLSWNRLIFRKNRHFDFRWWSYLQENLSRSVSAILISFSNNSSKINIFHKKSEWIKGFFFVQCKYKWKNCISYSLSMMKRYNETG